MCICDNSYPRKLAFSYLDELSKEFQRSYGDKIDGATRPYAFMGFGECIIPMASQDDLTNIFSVDTFIGKTTRLYRDSRSLTQGGGPAAGPSSRLDQLNENLKNVTQIMTKNMEDLLWRGDSLDRESFLPYLAIMSPDSCAQECHNSPRPCDLSQPSTVKRPEILILKHLFVNGRQ